MVYPDEGAGAPAVRLPDEGSRAHEMLMAVVAELRSRGSVDMSVRQLAAAIGTSHRMLQYYFGTREQLLEVVMMQLSREYIATVTVRPTSRAETIQATWERFLDPSNRLQTQILFTLSGAAAERPDLEIPGLNLDLDNFAAGLTAFGVKEGLPLEQSENEARFIVAALLGHYLDFFIAKENARVSYSFQVLKDWVERSSADAAAGRS